jgi:hypothetical protein
MALGQLKRAVLALSKKCESNLMKGIVALGCYT